MTNLNKTLDKTKIYKGFHGWHAETLTEVNGQTFQITTSKRHSKKIVSNSQPCEVLEAGGLLFNDMMNFDGKNLTLISEAGRSTEKTIYSQHLKAITIFDEKIKDIQPTKEQTPVIGTILFLSGYGKGKGSQGNIHIVYEVGSGYYGTSYKTVEITTLVLDSKDHVKDYKNKFGIGIYFEPGYKYEGDQNDLNNLVIEAKQKAINDHKKEEAGKIMRNQVRAGKIEEGKKLVIIPNWATCVIVADLYQNDSDSMTDYFSTSISKTTYLKFSKNTRNNMQELKNAAESWEDTKELLKNSNTIEYTRGHSYLPNYFIGSERWFGLKINKDKYFDLTNQDNKDRLYIAASEGRYFANKPDQSKTESVQFGDVQIIDYSDKAIAVIGDTKPIKELLKSLGGRFNFRLSCGAGWIFRKADQDKVKKALNI